jgi:hypothetical protein
MKKIIVLAIALLALSFSGKLAAQTKTPKIHQKQVNQEARIQEGKKSGELTKRETRRLQTEQAVIQHDKKQAKADGVVTPTERKEIRKEQRAASRDIYHQKHDVQTKK